VFTTIVFPLAKYSILSGAIMAFTRSLGETGATVAVTTDLKTVPVVIVEWVRGIVPATPLEIGLSVGILLLLSFIVLFLLRMVTKGKGRY
jgi:thiamine transport system permease protein